MKILIGKVICKGRGVAFVSFNGWVNGHKVNAAQVNSDLDMSHLVVGDVCLFHLMDCKVVGDKFIGQCSTYQKV